MLRRIDVVTAVSFVPAYDAIPIPSALRASELTSLGT